MLTSKIATEIGSLLIEDRLEIVGLLVGPGELGSYSHLSFGADEHIMRPNVSDFEVGGVESLSRHDD